MSHYVGSGTAPAERLPWTLSVGKRLVGPPGDPVLPLEREGRSRYLSRVQGFPKPTMGFEPMTPALRERCSGQLSYVGAARGQSRPGLAA